LTSENKKVRVATALDLLSYISPKPKATDADKPTEFELTEEDRQIVRDLFKKTMEGLAQEFHLGEDRKQE